MGEVFKRCKEPFVIKDGCRYKVIKTDNFTFLDQMQYLPPGYSLDKFITSFGGKSCKGLFPYEFLDSFSKLSTNILDIPHKSFYSRLRGGDEYEWLKSNQENVKRWIKYYTDLGCVTLMDMLRVYNNLDVKPFLEACLKQNEFYISQGLDMYQDGLSVSALSEKILFSYQLKEFRIVELKRNDNITFIPTNIKQKLESYVDQDVNRIGPNAIRPCIEAETCTEFEVVEKLKVQDGKCYYCHEKVCENTWSLDRIDCDKCHTNANTVLSCIGCNVAKKDRNYRRFRREKQLLRFAYDNRVIKVIDDDNSEVFKLMKANIVGGPSLVLHRFHKRDATKIQHLKYEGWEGTHRKWSIAEDGKFVKKIIGYDANALYLSCVGGEMPCGELWLDKPTNPDKEKWYIERACTGEFEGFLEVDIEVPDEKTQYFAQFPPLFMNLTYSTNEDNPKQVRKLIAGLAARKQLIKSTRLKWLAEHGCVVTTVHSVIGCKFKRVFKDFTNTIAEERLKKGCTGEMFKMTGNSSVGRTAMDKNKHKTVKYCERTKFTKLKYRPFYYDATNFGDIYEVFMMKSKILQNRPIQVQFSVYEDAKLRMCEFVYDFVDKFIDRCDYQLMYMDTDSMYIAFSAENFEDCIKPELIIEYQTEKFKWFDDVTKVPGSFKEEFRGDEMVALCSKMYCVKSSEKEKVSAKGVQRRNTDVLKMSHFDAVLNNTAVTNKALNINFRFERKSIKTCESWKKALLVNYDKGRLVDNIWVAPLDIILPKCKQVNNI